MEALGLGVLGGLIASLVFLLTLSLVRPRLQISPEIAMVPAEGPGEENEYRFKAVNRSRRACVDVDILAYVVTTRPIPAKKQGKFGTHRFLDPIDLRRHQGAMIPGYRRSDEAQKFAHLIRFEESAAKVLHKAHKAESSAFILVRIVARDSWTGFPRMFEREFRLSSQIRTGVFSSGSSFEIHPFSS